MTPNCNAVNYCTLPIIDLKHIIAQGESETVEFKSNFNTEAIEPIVAFDNSKGGSVYIGINDVGKVIGVSTNKESILNMPRLRVVF